MKSGWANHIDLIKSTRQEEYIYKEIFMSNLIISKRDDFKTGKCRTQYPRLFVRGESNEPEVEIDEEERDIDDDLEIEL